MIPEKKEREEIARLAEDIAQFAWEKRLEGVSVQATKSSEVDIVTDVDTMIEEYAKERIKAVRPQDGFLGEESEGTSGYSGLTWVVDPIDGTVNYLYGIGTCAVSVAVVTGAPDPSLWTVVAGCVALIGQSRVYRAQLGGGAYLNGNPIHVSDVEDVSHSLVATGFSYDADTRGVQGEVVAKVLPQVRDIRRIGAASTDLCAVAAGFVDAYWETGLKPWDMAAGSLIVTEAGGVVENLNGGKGDCSIIIAGNPRVVENLREILREADVEKTIQKSE